jgi:CRISPR-associated protein Csb1
MSIDLSRLANTRRVLLNVPVRPIQGHRFQPTGFPDLGAATYSAPINDSESIPCLLVESAQSMANRLELTIWDTGRNELKEAAKGLSYVRVVDEEQEHLTSSIQEAHCLNSAYIERADGGEFHQTLANEMACDKKRPVNRRKFVDTVFRYDVNSLLHGVFLESIDGRLRIARALSSFIEAEHAEVAASGGVKNDHVQPGKEGEQTASEGFGNVPFPREEYVARTITAFFNLDLGQIRGYGLDPDATQLLIVLGLYKIRALLDGDLRLRTACDLTVDTSGTTDGTIQAACPKDWTLPSLTALEDALKDAIQACAKKKGPDGRTANLFGGENGVKTVTYKPAK